MELLPTEIIHEIAFRRLTSPTDILSLALTSRTLHTHVLGVLGEENEYDGDQHRATAGIAYCCSRGWWRAAQMAVERGYGDHNHSWEDDKGRTTTPLTAASSHGIVPLVKTLLALPEIDPGSHSSVALRRACANGHAEVVEMLLADPRVDPSAKRNACLNLAVHSGNEETVRLVLEDERVDPTDSGPHTLGVAIKSGSASCLRILLEDGRIDPRARQCSALRKASWTGNVELVAALVEDGRLTQGGAGVALRTAQLKGWTEIVELLSTIVD